MALLPSLSSCQLHRHIGSKAGVRSLSQAAGASCHATVSILETANLRTGYHARPSFSIHRQQRLVGLGGRNLLCRASTDTEESSTSNNVASSTSEDVKIKKTMAGLDALLGIQEDDKSKKASTSAAASQSSDPPTSISVSSEAMSKIAEAEAQRLTRGDANKATGVKTDIEDQFQKIIDKARKLADEQSTKKGQGSAELEQAALRQEFEALLQTISKSPDVLDKDDIKRLKDAVFGPMTFWVTETKPIQEAERTGLLIRGNLRDDRDKIFKLVCEKVKELFGDKYEVLMVEDIVTEDETPPPPSASAKAGPRVAFQIIPAAQALPPQTDGWKQAAAFALSLLLIASCVQLALAANITKLPKETLDWFANPANLESDQLPPGLETWDPTAYFNTAVPILSSILGINLAHEIGHRIAAGIKGVKLGPSYFVPNFQIGSFGAITPFTSLVKDRKTLWDVAAAGPLAGGAMSLTLLVMGLLGSDPASVPAEALVPVPTPLFQGSLLLGTITRLALGEEALRGSEVLVSPLAIAGWCGLVTTALNMLPVGSLDGGRMIQAAFGRQAQALSSFFTYVGLGLGLLGSSLALPFGLYVIICQRTAEKYIQDSVSPAGDARQTATAIAVLTAILVLLPMAPELAEAWGIGPATPFF
mmetsp:Transcript_30997/g.68746  ORF Transcript_30997/g.68746 Transcript_30997/m.68746 type:complete len:647 (+) Transcript_30997:142-2082(+)